MHNLIHDNIYCAGYILQASGLTNYDHDLHRTYILPKKRTSKDKFLKDYIILLKRTILSDTYTINLSILSHMYVHI